MQNTKKEKEKKETCLSLARLDKVKKLIKKTYIYIQQLRRFIDINKPDRRFHFMNAKLINKRKI
jgi:hypothetical protein